MLAIHWTPVNNTKKIIRNGITKSHNGLYCFPLTGHRTVDQWWVKAFNHFKWRDRVQYNGIVFRIEEADLPAYFGDYAFHTTRDVFIKEITSLKDLQQEYRETILWRIGERIFNYDWQKSDEYLEIATEELKKEKRIISNAMNDLGFMEYIFENYQIVLSKSIAPNRIIKIITSRNEYGRILYKSKKDKYKHEIE